ncbi:Lon protease-like, mitochondrial [Hondaea fermentalgiana]|uniref:Lon protease homolog n=1 Tax=Hondaea fermentalgiana TaxID=2315210 RepID=A0A2R5G8P4_9STRA|nr:Lon protease-like, mitochondrial [Hondaea fermentalgiana]|eukprot:GBG27417.1 Lon protease-like, mitochondrial [Hondaea fermentalgiana]
MKDVHKIGTFAQIVQMEPMRELLSPGHEAEHNDGFGDHGLHHREEATIDFQDPVQQRRKQDLRNALFEEDELTRARAATPNEAVASAREESWTLVVKAHRKIQLEEILKEGPPPLVQVQHLTEFPLENFDRDVIRAYTNEVLSTLRDVMRTNPLMREHMHFFSTRFDMSDPYHVCNFAASLTSADGDELQEVLEAFNLETRLSKVLALLKKEAHLNDLQQEISRQVEETISANQRKYFLNEQLKQIKKELGLEHDDKDALLAKYEKQFRQLQGLEPEETDSKGNKQDGSEKTNERTYIYEGLPAEAEKVIKDEMKKLSTLEKTSPEFNVTRAYLDWLMAMPWGRHSVENLDISRARDVLESDHFGLKDIKERILEFIAVGNLRGTVQGKIILLVGPPGVGKTSIGQSIAHALDREFYRFSVGGLSDVSEIKGHRRTYIGSMPGKLVQCLKTAGVSNPVVLIDEIDKLGSSGFRGDPSSAMLELLDPAQNNAFMDHYLDVPIDLSKVLFVCTANDLSTIPGPLLDRMEVLRLSGYDLPEKVQIAKRYLEPRARRESGLALPEDDKVVKTVEELEEPSEDMKKNPTRASSIEIPKDLGLADSAVESLARWYCREAGVRNLEQHIERIYRKISLELLMEQAKVKDDLNKVDADAEKDADKESAPRTSWVITDEDLEKYVGKRKFDSDKLYGSVPPAGVVMGLAWSSVGGSALYIESTCIRQPPRKEETTEDGKTPARGPGSPFSVHSTGQLGDVMQESVRLAQTNAKHFLQEVSPGSDFFEANQIHLHVPEGATPKDGPSAGVTMTTALLSLALGKSVKADLAMTGEISLIGRVLPVGGIKEKVIAARRAGVDTIVVPDGNRKDVDELPDYLREGIDFHFAKEYKDVYRVAFQEELASSA